MPPFVPLSEVVEFLKRAQYEVRPGMERVVGVLMAENAALSKEMIGHEIEAWPPLAESTVREKERLGFVGHVSATDPLLRTGKLRDSIQPVVHVDQFIDVVGEVGSDLPYSADLEHGTKHIPARPFISAPFMTMEPRASEALGKLALDLVIPDGPMLTSFETGAIFVLQDQFSEPLRRLMSGLGEADASIKKMMESSKAFGLAFGKDLDAISKSLGFLNTNVTCLDTSFANWGRTAETAANSVLGALARVDTAVAATTARLEAMSAGGAAGGAGAATASRAERSAPWTIPLLGVSPLLGGLAAAAGAGYEAAGAQHAAAKALFSGNLDPLRDMGIQRDEWLRLLQSGSSATGSTIDAVGEAYQSGSRLLPGMAPSDRTSLITSLLRNSQFEASMKGTTLEESLSAVIELAHQAGIYDPAAIKQLSGQFAVASQSTNASLPDIVRTSGYFLPTLRAGLGMDTATGLSFEIAMKNAGVMSTRSGTDLRSFYEGLEPQVRGRGAKDHNDALAKLGLLGEDGRPNWEVRGKDGAIDWFSSSQNAGSILEQHLAGMSDADRLGFLKGAFGERGGVAGSLLATKSFRDQAAGIHGRVSAYGDSDLLAQLEGADPMQKVKETWSDLKNVLVDLGTIVLPPLNIALTALDVGLKAIHGTFSLFEKSLPEHRAVVADPTDPNPLFHQQAFRTYANDNPLTDAVYGGFLKAFREISGGGASSVFGSSGGGLTNASFTTFGSGGGGGSVGVGGLFSPGGGKTAGVNPVLQAMIHRASEIAGVPLSVYSGYRSPEHNAAVGGAEHSLHMNGWATDLASPGHPKGDLAFWSRVNQAMGQAAAEMHQPYRWGGTFGGRYSRDNDHFDLTSRGPVGRIPNVIAPPVRRHDGPTGDLVVQLDGKELYRNNMQRMIRRARFATSVGQGDAHGSFMGPQTPMIDAA